MDIKMRLRCQWPHFDESISSRRKTLDRMHCMSIGRCGLTLNAQMPKCELSLSNPV